jgi:NADH-quinone oxidoreductase subunit L
LIPQFLLAIGAIVAGFLPFGNFVSSDGAEILTHIDWNFSVLPILLSVAGISLAFVFFFKKDDKAIHSAERFGVIYRSLKNKLYVDEVYNFITKKIIFRLIGTPAAWIDKNIVDGAVNTSAKATQVFSMTTSIWQSGKVQSYAIWFLIGTIGILALCLHFLQML